MDKKDKRLFINIGSAFVIKGIALAISFWSLPLYIKFFDNDIVLGLWFTILSVLTWVLTFDFGIGNGLRNKLVKPIEDKNNKSIKEYISSSYIILGALTLIIAIVIIPLVFIINWNYFFNVDFTLVPRSLLIKVVIINISGILLQFFLRLINSILYSLQKSSINNFLALVSSVITFLFIFLYKGSNVQTNLVLLSMVHLIAVTAPLFITTIIVFSTSLRKNRPNINCFNKEKAKGVFFSGGKIFINQLLYLGLVSTNAFLISFFIDPSQVVEYQMYYKVFILSGTLYGLALTPLWSAVTQAHVNKDYKWINKYFNLMMLGAIVVLLGQYIGTLLLQFGFDIWLQSEAPIVNYTYAVIFATFGGVFTLQATVSTFAMGFNKPKLQAIMYAIALLLKLILIKVLIKSYPVWILIVFIDIIVIIPYIVLEYISVKKLIKENLDLIIVKERTD